MLNHCTFVGRLVADPELVYTEGTNIARTNFCVAVDRDWVAAGGKRETEFIPCTSWRGAAEMIANYWKKGGLVYVSGRLSIRSYIDKETQRPRKAFGIDIGDKDRVYSLEKRAASPATEVNAEETVVVGEETAAGIMVNADVDPFV